jgi:hypothetical protein
MTANLAARGARNFAGAEERHVVHGDVVGARDRGADGGADRREIAGHAAGRAVQFDRHDDALLAADLGGEDRIRAVPKPVVRHLVNGGFDVLGVELAAGDDHQILDATGHGQLAVAHDAEIAGPQIGPAPVGELRTERRRRLRRSLPIAHRNARPFDPDLAFSAIGAWNAAFRIDDQHVMSVDDVSAGRAAELVVSRRRIAQRPAAFRSSGHHQGCLGQSVAGDERTTRESAGPERAGKAFEHIEAHGFGADEGAVPAC